MKDLFLKLKPSVIAFLLLFLITMVVAINIKQEMDVDKSKIPQKVELSKGFQKWITNMKNKDFDIGADDFKLLEENEVFNSKTMTIFSSEDKKQLEELEKQLAELIDTPRVVYSPSKKRIIDYREIEKYNYLPNQARFYGLKEDKIIEYKAVECPLNTNCYIDRAYFVDNDIFVVSEVSRNVNKRDPSIPECSYNSQCDYTVKIHVVDMVRNSRSVYVSNPFVDSLERIRSKI